MSEPFVLGAVAYDPKVVEGFADQVLALDRRLVRQRAVARFGVDRMTDQYVEAYRHIIDLTRRGAAIA